uniref:Aromatic amino acid beta-eliminating lyase/threonine aldolase domain-containing protein n=1 Tax=Moniliophthora roreri TaxID=221103 RepID=A0A0W0FY12_MONRR
MSSTTESARANVAELVNFDILSSATATLDNNAKRKEVARTFISDTVTVPTKEMYAYATLSSLGDDVYHDPTTFALEAHIAKITGKEAGLFMPSGTASNQISIRTHLKQPPYTVLCDHRSHIYKYEVGGCGFHSGAAVSPVIPSNGEYSGSHSMAVTYAMNNRPPPHSGRRKSPYGLWSRRSFVGLASCDEPHLTERGIASAPTEVIALENTLNGTIFPQEEITAISEFARSQDVKMHLDGARIWHVAAETGTPLEELCKPFDTVSLCFSKGLGAPVGSCLVGPKEFIQRARRIRKMFGGGMRQTGILAGSAAYALTYNFPQLPRVHALARKLEQGLEKIGVDITSRAETCMVFYDAASIGTTYDEIAERGQKLPEPLHLGGSRLVVHIQTSDEAVDDFLALISEIANEKKAAGFVKSERKVNGTGDVYVRRSR